MVDISERVTRLEEQMKTNVTVTYDNTKAIRELTAVLNHSRGALWIVSLLITLGASIGGLLAWFLSKFSFAIKDL